MYARLVRIAVGAAAAGCVALTGCVVLGGCSSDAPPPAEPAPPSPVPVAGAGAEPRADLARRATAARDRRFTAEYTWTGAGGRRTVSVTRAADGTWRVDIPRSRGELSMVGRPDGVYQCAEAGCVRVAAGGAPGGGGASGAAVPAAYDPRVQHPFTDWPGVLSAPKAALAVTVAKQVPGAAGICFSVEPTMVAIASPIEAGIFCYDDSGLMTAVRAGFGTLVLAGNPGSAPATVGLPGPVRAGPPVVVVEPSSSSSRK